MKNILLACISCVFFLAACSQTRNAVQKSYAFYHVSFPGNMPVDENGKPMRGVDTLRVIYIELKGSEKPQIKTVQYKGVQYDAAVYAEENPVNAGTLKMNNQRVQIKPNEGNSLWRVELTPSSAGSKAETNEIILQGTLNGKRFTHKINNDQELAAPLYQ